MKSQKALTRVNRKSQIPSLSLQLNDAEKNLLAEVGDVETCVLADAELNQVARAYCHDEEHLSEAPLERCRRIREWNHRLLTAVANADVDLFPDLDWLNAAVVKTGFSHKRLLRLIAVDWRWCESDEMHRIDAMKAVVDFYASHEEGCRREADAVDFCNAFAEKMLPWLFGHGRESAVPEVSFQYSVTRLQNALDKAPVNLKSVFFSLLKDRFPEEDRALLKKQASRFAFSHHICLLALYKHYLGDGSFCVSTGLDSFNGISMTALALYNGFRSCIFESDRALKVVPLDNSEIVSMASFFLKVCRYERLDQMKVVVRLLRMIGAIPKDKCFFIPDDWILSDWLLSEIKSGKLTCFG